MDDDSSLALGKTERQFNTIIGGKKVESPSIFTKIIRGEIPSHKIYEDEGTFAFLDIHPQNLLAHVLVVSKTQIDRVYELPDEDYAALWATVKKLAKHMEAILDERIIYVVLGNQVPHAHVHLMPFDPEWNPKRIYVTSKEDLEKIAEKLRLN